MSSIPIDWKTRQMIKASGWPLAPEQLAPGADFNAPVEGGLVPLHWACAEGKAGLLAHMIEHGARVAEPLPGGQTALLLALEAQHFQCVMLVIEALKTAGAPPPGEALAQRLMGRFSGGHVNSKNRLQQTLRDWQRLAKKAR